VAAPARDPLAGTDRLLVDGTNLRYALERQAARGATPPSALIGRLRAMVPGTIRIEVVFDGGPEPGMRGERIASGVVVRHSGRRSADEVLLELIERDGTGAGALAPARTGGILVVTSDRALRTAIHARGARTAGTAWLLERLQRPRLAASSVGNRRPPGPDRPDERHGDETDGEDNPRWTPGRGATTKRGNPRRRRRSSGTMPR
jgi:hypothetical protein